MQQKLCFTVWASWQYLLILVLLMHVLGKTHGGRSGGGGGVERKIYAFGSHSQLVLTMTNTDDYLIVAVTMTASQGFI
jgi:hypothetical protein